MKNFITQFSRLFVGILFIISGLIKLNDPIGFSYKLAEYFSEPVFNLPFLEPISLYLAVFLVIVEVVLGIMLLIGYKTKLTIWSLLLMIVFFTFLTFYSAYFNVVKDCGCFGDALHLTPWESFGKDVILLVFILILFVNQRLILPLFNNNNFQNAIVYLGLAVCIFIAYMVINHLPYIDFRPYKVGTNIQKRMEIPAGAPTPVVEMIFIYKVNGTLKEFSEKDLMSLPEGAEFVDRKDKIISQGYVPPIHDFTMTKDNSDYKDELLLEPKLVMIVTYDLKSSKEEGMQKLSAIEKEATSKGYKVIGMTNSSQDEIAKAQKKYNLKFDFYTCDAIALKTIERANPSIVILNKGTIKQKVHYNDTDKLKL